MDCAIRLHGPRRVLELVIRTLGELRGVAHTLIERCEILRVYSVLHAGVVTESGANFGQRRQCPVFGLRGRVPLPLRHNEPQETPHGAE